MDMSEIPRLGAVRALWRLHGRTRDTRRSINTGVTVEVLREGSVWVLEACGTKSDTAYSRKAPSLDSCGAREGIL